MDEQIGRVVREILALGLEDRTVLVLTGDHGEGRGEHDEDTHSYFLYDSVMRVPLIFWGGDLPAGRRVTALARTVDITPTLLDLLDLAPLQKIQGVSLRPLLVGASDDLGLTAYEETAELRTLFGTSVLRSLRDARWKYIDKVNPQVFDVRNDPGERHDLAATRPKIAETLRLRLKAVLAETAPETAPETPPETPPETRQGAVSIDSETLSQLHALGYAGAIDTPRIAAALGAADLEGVDPLAARIDLRAFVQGWGSIRGREYGRAAAEFEALWDRYPESTPILFGLISATQSLSPMSEALPPLLRRGIELDPGFTPYSLELARLVPEEAEPLLRRAVEIKPCEEMPRARLASHLRGKERHAERLVVLESGIEQCPEALVFINEYA